MIYLSFFPDYKNHSNVNGNAILSEKLYLRYFKKEKDILLNTTSSNQYLTKIKKIIYSFYSLFLLISKKQKSIYTVLLDNFGFYPHVVLLFIASFFCKKIIIYHHSFKYITRKKPLLSFLNSKKIINIATSKKQFMTLKKKYDLQNVHLIQNFIFLLDKKKFFKKKINKKFKVIYFSSIMKRKGIYEFINLSKKFINKKNIKFFVYGNDCSPEIHKNLKYLKNKKIINDFKFNIYGQMKRRIFSNSDILIFPSKHISETTPLVLDECINYGLIPISYNIGDTKGQIGHLNLIVNSFNQLCKKLVITIKNYQKVKNSIIKEKKIMIVKKSKLIQKLDMFFLEEFYQSH